VPIIRRINCINTSGICHSVWIVTYTRCRIDTINSPDDGHMAARNIYRIEINIHEKNCALGWLFTKMVILTSSTGPIRKTILVLFFLLNSKKHSSSGAMPRHKLSEHPQYYQSLRSQGNSGRIVT